MNHARNLREDPTLVVILLALIEAIDDN